MKIEVIGTAVKTSPASSWTPFPSLTLDPGDRLFLALATLAVDDPIGGMVWRGKNFTLEDEGVTPVQTNHAHLYSKSGGTGDVVITYQEPTAQTALAAFKIRELPTLSVDLVRNGSTTSYDGTVRLDAIPSAFVTRAASEFWLAVLGTQGPPTDLPGSWRDGWQPIPELRVGVAGETRKTSVTLQVAYNITALPSIFQAVITGIGPVPIFWGMNAIAWKLP